MAILVEVQCLIHADEQHHPFCAIIDLLVLASCFRVISLCGPIRPQPCRVFAVLLVEEVPLLLAHVQCVVATNARETPYSCTTKRTTLKMLRLFNIK